MKFGVKKANNNNNNNVLLRTRGPCHRPGNPHLVVKCSVPKVCMDWIFDFLDPAPAASNRIMSEVFIPLSGSGLDLDLCLLKKTLLFV